MDEPKPGAIFWQDLTVEDGEGVRRFYEAVVGWRADAVDMGGYADYSMNLPGGECVAGICHARGGNTGLPAQWLLYVAVADLDASIAACRETGGEVIRDPRPLGKGRMCVVRDPAGAVCALYEPSR